MFETRFVLAGTIKVHCCNKFFSKLNASKRGRVPSIDDSFRKNRLITTSFAFSLADFWAESYDLRK